MRYALNIDGREYELPKKTLSVQEKIDRIKKEVGGRDRKSASVKKYEFVKEFVGEENAREIFETDKIEEVDVGTLEIEYKGMFMGYRAPELEFQANENMKALGEPVLDRLMQIAQSLDSINALSK